MPRRRGGILMALGLILALATGGLVYYLLRTAAPAAAVEPMLQSTPVPTRSIPVAAHALSVGATITDTDVVMRDYPESLVPAGVITDTAGLLGQTVVEPILEGELIRPSQLGSDTGGPLSQRLEPSKVAMAFSPDDLLNKSQVVHEGDRIDLLLTLDISEDTGAETRAGKATSYTVQNIEVARIVRDQPTEENPNPAIQAILFEMAPQDAVIVKFVKDSGGTLDFTLRSSANVEPFTTQAINQDFLLDTYGLRAPQSSTRAKSQ